MSFILSAQRDDDVVLAFARYQQYLESVRHALPASVFELASSEWYFSPRDHRSPHDAWLESVTVSEPSSGDHHQSRTTAIRIRLLGAYHDGFIELFYPSVFGYQLDAGKIAAGHQDWRFDEFRLSENGHVLHEIEWCGARETAHWLIECSDVQFHWHPDEDA